MPLDPLQTDEKLTKAVKKSRDLDTVMLVGCGGFVASSFTVYGLSVWPFFIIQDVFTTAQLAKVTAMGLLPAMLATAIIARKGGLAAACGTIGGALTTAIFLYLRMQQLFLAALAKTDKPAEYPDSLQFLLPLAFVLGILLLVILLLPKRELPFAEE